MEWADRVAWYSRQDVQFEIVRQTIGRETVFQPSKSNLLAPVPWADGVKPQPIRMLKIHSVDYLNPNFEHWRFLKRNLDLYASLAHLRNMPFRPFDNRKAVEVRGNFTSNYLDYAIDYDLAFDLEKHVEPPGVSRWQDCHADAKRLKEVLDEFGIQYILSFSGTRGFHFRINGEWLFPKSFTVNQRVDCAYHLAKEISEIENLPCIDYGILGLTRYLKVCYSTCGDKVCLPLTDAEFESFDDSVVLLDNVAQTIKPRERGLLVRNTGAKADIVKFMQLYRGGFNGKS